MPWQGDHGWHSHLRGLATRHENGHLSDEGYAAALERFANRFEERGVSTHRLIFDRKSDLGHANRLRKQAQRIREGK